MVVRESVYHEVMQAGSRPTIHEPPSRSYPLTTDEQPYQTSFEVGQDWTPIPHGWITKASMMMLWNEELDHFRHRPTKEEVEAVKGNEVYLCRKLDGTSIWRDNPFAMICPGDPALRMRAVSLGTIHLYCPSGKAKVRVILYPV